MLRLGWRDAISMIIFQPLSRKSQQAVVHEKDDPACQRVHQWLPENIIGETYRKLLLVGVVVPVVFIGLAIEPESRIDKIAEKECADAGSDVGYLVDLLL